MNQIDHAKIRREGARWIVLLTLNHARPTGSPEGHILSVLQSEYPDATAQELRKKLDYLAERGLIALDKQPNGHWHAKLSRDGIDVVDYTVPCEPGIARPTKYWAG